MKFGIKILLLAAISGLCVQLHAQNPTANFTADKTQGCPPALTIQYTDASTGNNLTYNWDLGNGNTSTEKNPAATYLTPGFYTVKLTVNDGTASSSKSLTVRVFNPPTVDFKATPTKGCVPFTTSFQDLSTKGDGNIIQWKWDFRDGSTRTTQNTSYTYSEQKKHAVYLKVTDANNCSAELEKLEYIDVANKPSVSFTPSPANSCKIPQIVTFTNTSTGIGTLIYEWTFGNGKTSVIQHPQTTYDNYGTYNVRLKVTNNTYNCENSFEYPAVKITQIKAGGFLIKDNDTLSNNDTICNGVISFTNQSIGSSIAYWDFGDGTPTSTFPSGTHSFNNAGKYIVKLIASPGNQCADTFKWTINVQKPVADFSFNPTTACVSPIPVTFTSSSTGSNSYLWEFHDNSTKTGAVTNFTYFITPNPDPFAINDPINYAITLNAYSSFGCVSKIIKNFTINLPTARFTVDKEEGCLPLTVNFSDNSLPGSNIASRKWEFGDNTNQTTTGTTGMHIYNTPGIYNARLIVTDKQNCLDTSYNVEIKIGKTPSPDFSVTTPTSFYTDELIQFNDLTPGTDNANYWNYFINGVSVSDTLYNQPNPNVKFNIDTGKLTVKLVVGNNGCYNQVEKASLLTCLGPISSFIYDMNCSTPKSYQFQGVVKGATSYKWDFGDGNINTVSLNPTHNYATEGDYSVKLISYNNGHTDTAKLVLFVRVPDAIITSLTSKCINNGLYLNGAQSYKSTNNYVNNYKWSFGDNSKDSITPIDSIFHIYDKRGTFKVRLIASYDNGCVDSAFQNIRVYSPYANIKADTTSGCDHLNAKLSENSLIDGAALNKWEWNFANGTDSTVLLPGVQITKQFDLPNNNVSWEYPVTLKITDADGCEGSDTLLIRISKPSAQFSEYSATTLCHTDSLILLRNYLNPDSVIWYFGDGTISRDINKKVTHKYNNAGEFRIALKLYKYYCTDSVIKPLGYVKIQKADAHFIVSDTLLNCTGEINFNHNAVMSPVDSGRWNFGDGYTGLYDTIRNHTFVKPGTYNAQLKVYTTLGCSDTYTKTISIKGPYADFAATPRQACKGDTVLFELRDTINLYKWEWDFGEGIFYKNKDKIKYAFKSVGTKKITITVYSVDTANCKTPIPRDFKVEEVISTIGIADTSVCATDTVSFENLSVGNTYFDWNLGDGTTSNLTNPLQVYNSPGIYYVKLNIGNSNNGCKDTATQAILVNPKPVVTLTNDTVICEGGIKQLIASGGNVYSWFPTDSLSAINISNPISSADSSITYYVNVSIDSTGCMATDSVKLSVQQKFQNELNIYRDKYMFPKDSIISVFVGDEIQLKVENPDVNLIYTWNPQTGITCQADCSIAYIKPESSVKYILTTSDIYNCFINKDTLNFTIKDTCIFDVAKAFTPSGAAENRILQVKGKGIKELVEFKIYNRWGNVVFQSNDIEKGWDGTYQGKEQPIDTYIYTITVLTYKNFTLSKKGSVLLIR